MPGGREALGSIHSIKKNGGGMSRKPRAEEDVFRERCVAAALEEGPRPCCTLSQHQLPGWRGHIWAPQGFLLAASSACKVGTTQAAKQTVE